MSYTELETVATWDSLRLVRETYFPTWYGMERERFEYPIVDSASVENYDNVTATYQLEYVGTDTDIIITLNRYGVRDETYGNRWLINGTDEIDLGGIKVFQNPATRTTALELFNKVVSIAWENADTM